MEFPVEIEINLTQAKIPNISTRNITINSGITIFLGPNGSGKTQLLRGLRGSLRSLSPTPKKVRYVSAGRLGPLENYRSNYDGQRGDVPNFDNAQYGAKGVLQYRHQSETVLGDFGTLAARPDILIKIQERLKRLFKRDLHIDWDGGHLKVNFTRIDRTEKSYSSAREASGLIHLVAILAALYDDEVGYVLIDEPEVSLHPQLQSFLLQEMMKVAGNPDESDDHKKLIFLSTHSTEFVEIKNVDDLASIVFFKDIYESPIQIDPNIPEFRGRKIQALLARMGQEHKLALFSDTPLLVEGPSDQTLCSAISRKLEMNIEAAGSQILPVTGKGQMPVVLKLFRLIGKSPSILADADAFADGVEIINSFTNLPIAAEIASSEGHRDANHFARDVYRDFSNLVLNNWDDISGLAENHSYWINRDTDKDEIIAKRRAAFCTLLTSTENNIASLNNAAAWLTLKTRIMPLLKLLKKIGCHILTKGTIEAYYCHANNLTSDEKPNAASHEASCLLGESGASVRESYNDIVTAIEFVSQAEEIDEAKAIRDMVLAIITPSLASLADSTSDGELNSFSRSLFGDKASLFKLEKNGEGENLQLLVHLESAILDIKIFPLTFDKSCNPIESVNRQMGLQ
jgi:energy-coupling factor transporter ATP-binding protein EcfA2